MTVCTIAKLWAWGRTKGRTERTGGTRRPSTGSTRGTGGQIVRSQSLLIRLCVCGSYLDKQAGWGKIPPCENNISGFSHCSLQPVSCSADVPCLQAQQASSSAVKAGRWSDAATWADKKVPAEGAVVTINQGMDVVLDVSTPPLHGLTINGKLSFANNKDLELTTEWIMLHGELEIGTEKAPHTRKATITFTNNVKDEDISGVGGTTDRLTAGSCSWAEP